MIARLSPVVILAAIAAAAPVGAAESMQPGLWEIRVNMTMPGMENMHEMPEQVIKKCLQGKDIEAGVAAPAQSECKVNDYKVEGGTATWQIACSDDMPMTGSGHMTTSATAYDGAIDMTMGDEEGGSMAMHQTISGKRIGDCK